MKKEIKQLQKWFEANYLDGDKIQDGQMLSSKECFSALEQTHKQGYEKGFIDGTGLTGRIAEEEIAELQKKVSEEFDKIHKNPFKQGYKKGYKQGREDEREETIKYHKKQIKIHKHFLEEYTVAPFEWHRGRKDEASDAIEHLTNK